MSIIGLTDEIVPRWPRLGKLRKGGEKTTNGYGPDLDHFRFTSDNVLHVAAFEAAFGAQPHSIRVYIPHQTIEQAFPTWCEVWGASGLKHRCNGKTMSIWLAGDKYERGERPCEGGHEKGDPRNDAVGRLDLIIPELIQAGFVGYVTLETHSIHDVLNISRALAGVYQARLDLRGVEFILRRSQEEISVPGWGERAGQRTKVKKWLVRIEPAADWVQLQLAATHAAAMQLPAPAEVVDSATGEITGLPRPAVSESIDPEEEKYFGKPSVRTVPAAAPTPTKPNGKPPSKAAVEKRWAQLWQWKIALAVDFPPVPGNATIEQLITAGKALKERLLYAAKSRLDPAVNWPDDDSAIQQAVALAQQASKADKPANGKPPSRQALLDHYEALTVKAIGLGVPVKALALDKLSDALLIDTGKSLKEKVVAEARKRLAMAWGAGKTNVEPAGANDEQAIAIAIELAIQEQEAAHA